MHICELRIANCRKQDLRSFHLESFGKKKSATWKVFVFSAPDVIMHPLRQAICEDIC